MINTVQSIDPVLCFWTRERPSEGEVLAAYRTLRQSHSSVTVILSPSPAPAQVPDNVAGACLKAADWKLIQDLALCLSPTALAARLGMSIPGIKSKINRLHRTLGVRGPNAALRFCVANGLLSLMDMFGATVTLRQWKELLKTGSTFSTRHIYDDYGRYATLALVAGRPCQVTTARSSSARQS